MSLSQNKKANTAINVHFILIFMCFGIETAALLIASFFSFAIDVKSADLYLVSTVSLCVGCLISAFITVRKRKRNGLLNGILYCLPANIFYMLLSSAFNSFEIDMRTAVSFIIIVAFSAIGGIVSVNFKQKIKIKSKR